MILFFIPYIPLVFVLLFCWDIISEDKAIHKIFGIILIILVVLIIFLTYFNIGFPGQMSFYRWSTPPQSA